MRASAMYGGRGLRHRRHILIATASVTIERSIVLKIKKTSHIVRHWGMRPVGPALGPLHAVTASELITNKHGTRHTDAGVAN